MARARRRGQTVADTQLDQKRFDARMQRLTRPFPCEDIALDQDHPQTARGAGYGGGGSGRPAAQDDYVGNGSAPTQGLPGGCRITVVPLA